MHRAPRGGYLISKRRWKWLLLGIILVLVALYVLRSELRRSGFRWMLFVSSLAHLNAGWLVAACLFGLATYYGRALRWVVLLRPMRPHPNQWNVFSATVIGFMAITVLGRPGEFVRPYLIALKENVPFSSQLAAWVLERIYDLLLSLAIFGFALSQVGKLEDLGPALGWVLAVGGWVVWIASALCLLLLIGIRSYSDRVRGRLLDALGFLSQHHLDRARHFIEALIQGAESIRSVRSILLLVLYTILEWSLIASCYVCVTRSFAATMHFTIVDVLILMGFVSFGAVVQIPGVGGGVQLVTVLVLTKVFGLPVEAATSLAVILWATTFVVIVPFGLVLALHEGLSWRKLRQLEQEAAP